MIIIQVSILKHQWWHNFIFDTMNLVGDMDWFELGINGREQHINNILKQYDMSFQSKKDILTFNNDVSYSWFVLRWS